MAGNSLESNFVSMKHAVEFLNIQDQYHCNEDLQCTFTFNDYSPQEGDRVAIFKLGWNFVKDYIVFEWAPVSSEENICTVTFNKHILPKKNFEEIYQICYLSGENELHGASSPFQFSADKIIPVEVIDESVYQSLTKPKISTTNNSDNEKIQQLREENILLKQALKVALAQKDPPTVKNYDKEIAEIQQSIGTMNLLINSQQQELNMLKTKILESKEEYKKLYLEKYKVEKKYENLLNKKDKEIKPLNNVTEFDISNLESIPPFPFTNKFDK